MTSATASERASTRSGGIFDIANKLERIADLDRQAGFPEFWNDAAKAREILKTKTTIERGVERFTALDRHLSDAETLLELADELSDPESAEEATRALEGLELRIRQMEIRRMFAEEGDEASAVLEINAGAGGTDASDWADILRRMYLRWADTMGFKAKVIDESPHEIAGVKSVSIEIEGEYAYGYLKSEIGVHRLVRISPFDANARRQTSFASVSAYPEADDDIDIVIREADLLFEAFRSGGPGGQSVNTTDSAVRITHVPSGIVVKCQTEKSQLKNRGTAMKMLRARLYQLEIQRRQEARDAVNAQKKKIEWGSQIRNYIIHPYRLIKDVRTGEETSDTEGVLNGELLPFMEAWLAGYANGTLRAGSAVGAE
jgi:peptide chain release factor 2